MQPGWWLVPGTNVRCGVPSPVLTGATGTVLAISYVYLRRSARRHEVTQTKYLNAKWLVLLAAAVM